uniref:Queuine tRNA-ribosyltransferase n=1 Tax=Zeugodacus cucurbitae TaxID=28588 RepID=A0A0A1X9P4_ZEUCU
MSSYPSNRGYTAMVNRSPRFKIPPESKYPAPNAYDYVRPEADVKICYPFNSSDTRFRLQLGKQIGPSPSDYYHYRRRVEPVEMAFGKQRFVIPAYSVFCGAENKSRCFKCQTQPEGDYYHNFDHNLDLCRPCMNAEIEELNNCKYERLKRSNRLRALGKYKPARWCDFFHKHYSGDLSVDKYPRTVLRLKTRVENYLQTYDTMHKWYVQY